MALKLDGFEGRGTFAHGIHPPGRKRLSKDAAIRVMPTPNTVVLSLHQNIGGPCEPLVKARQKVAWGESDFFQAKGNGDIWQAASRLGGKRLFSGHGYGPWVRFPVAILPGARKRRITQTFSPFKYHRQGAGIKRQFPVSRPPGA